jgi:hypothetical protein
VEDATPGLGNPETLVPPFGGGGGIRLPPPLELVLDELLALVAQLPDAPLTLFDALLSLKDDELLLQLYAVATFGVGFKIKNIPAMEIVMVIVQIRIFISSQIGRIDKRILQTYTEKSSINKQCFLS